MLYKNNFDTDEIKILSDKIYKNIVDSGYLTKRATQEIQMLMSSGNVFVCIENGELIGFLLKSNLTGDCFELKSWWVRTDMRGKGIGLKLVENALNQKGTYLIYTFDEKLAIKLTSLKFNITRWNNLPLALRMRYLFSRNIFSIFRHLYTKKSYLLILCK